jgi:hypothetical protein
MKNQDTEEAIKWRYEQLAHQIEREDGLINTRIQWMLTFQGLLFTAIAFGESANAGNSTFLAGLRYIIPIVGIIVGFLAFLAVQAALSALKDLKALWNPFRYSGYPRPYGMQTQHSHGAAYSLGIPVVMICTWTVILFMPK